MGSQNLSPSFSLALVSCFLMVSSSLAYNFYVGGKDGWVLQPSESYSHWAERLRFLINDTLIFKYKEGKDSVLEVSKEDYYSCNTKKPLKSMTSGSSVYQFPHSGPFFFISGKKERCDKGQKLIVVVLSPRPSITPKPINPPSVSPTISPSPSSHHLSPSNPPKASPSPSPSPSSSHHLSPSNPPSTSPSPSSNPPSTSPSPSSEAPTGSPPSESPFTPSPSPSDQPADEVAPTPSHHSASTVVTASGVTVLGLTLFVSVAVLGLSP